MQPVVPPRLVLRFSPFALAIVLAATLAAPSTFARTGPDEAAPWPRFRGPVSTGAGVAQWPEHGVLELAWKRPLGTGYSGIVVAHGRLFTCFVADGSDWLGAFDPATGEERWRLRLGEAIPPRAGGHGGPIATPALGQGLIFALGGAGRLVAVRPDGEELWRRDLAERMASPDFGFGPSPLVADAGNGEVLVVQSQGREGRVLFGLDPTDGEELWSTGDDTVMYQSPVLARIGGRRQILVATQKDLRGTTPRGEVLWRHPFPTADQQLSPKGRGSDVPLPIGPDRVMIKPHAGGVEAVEVRFPPGCEASAQTSDRTTAESSDHSCEIVTETLWTSRHVARSYKPSVFYDGIVYGHKGGILSALDADSGELLWGSRSPGDGFLAAADGHLVVLTKRGSLHLGRAGRDGWNEESKLQVFDDDAWTEPTLANDAIFVRSMGELARVEVRPPDARHAAGIADSGRWIDESLAGADLPDTRFGRFVRSLRDAEDRTTAVGEFLAGVESFPIVEGEWAHFVYRGPEENVGISGTMVGERTEADMVPIPGTELHYFSSRLPRDAWVAYLFHVGEESTKIRDPRNPRVTHWPRKGGAGLDAVPVRFSYFTMPEATTPSYLLGEPQREGRIESHTLEVGDLDVEVERPPALQLLDIPEPSPQQRIRVYLPADYDPDRTRPYPVVFVFAGEKVLEGLDARRTLDHLLGDELPAAVVVFVDRHYDFLIADSGWAYELHRRAFFERVRPFVESTYRVGPEMHYAGFGFAGPIALRTAYDSRSEAGRVASVQPFLLDIHTGLFIAGGAAVPASERPSLYLETSRIDLHAAHESWDISVEHRKLVDALREQGWDVELVTTSRSFAWEAWRERLGPVLSFLLTGEAEVPDAEQEATAK